MGFTNTTLFRSSRVGKPKQRNPFKENNRTPRNHWAPEDYAKTPAPWEDRLACPPEMITTKTLENTTQLCSLAVEMDNRESPHQHRKKLLLSLHPNRLPGRTDSDTFFASIQSIRGYKCVQLFYSLLSCYTYVSCMRRESHSHQPCQDFVRNVGAPVTLLTDNAKKLIGKKWTKTSRENITKQRKTASHNQQQNQSEGRLGKVKTRTLLVMCKSNAPLIFWCYCLQFVVDCMNHSSVKSLDWKTPMDKLHGKTPTFPCSDSASGPLCGTTNPQQNSRRRTFSQRDT